jgi:hypothetical protein
MGTLASDTLSLLLTFIFDSSFTYDLLIPSLICFSPLFHCLGHNNDQCTVRILREY